MKTNYRIIFPLMAILFAFSHCKEKDDPCLLSVELFGDFESTFYIEVKATATDGLAPYTYQWAGGNGNPGSSYREVANGTTASVTVIDNLGCTATDSYTIGCPCLNGGTCLANGTCNCPDGYTGDYCDQPCRGCTVCGADTTVTIEGKVYKTVGIGTQCWMAENLSVSAGIAEETDGTQWGNLTTPAWCYYSNNSSNGAIYGKLYNWYAVASGSLCPSGWHIPTDAEWQNLVDYLGGVAAAGGVMKDTTGWTTPNTGATNSSGFTALPGGSRNLSGSFVSVGDYGVFWSSTENSTDQAWGRELAYNNSEVSISNSIKARGYSCRCVKD